MTQKSNLPCEITDKKSGKEMNKQNISQGEKHIYDLEERTYKFSKRVRIFVKKLPRTIANIEDGKQLIKASGSVGANYIEANESLSKKDFVFRIKICRKEAKESAYFLRLIKETNPKELENEALALYNEAIELKKIFSSIIGKSK
ncbi:MAG: four helix bundle protein [Candidatus Cloacimonadota bacterium]|nr:four helix bundle protein [Candidatus Cloacimonadota bacterium]